MTWWDRNIETVKQIGMSVIVIAFMLSVIVLAVWGLSGFDFKGGASALRVDLPEGCVSIYDGFLVPNPNISGVQLYELVERAVPINDVQYVIREDGIYVALRYVDGYTAVSRVLGVCIAEDGETVVIFSEFVLNDPPSLESSS